jgi:hypothetical protein
MKFSYYFVADSRITICMDILEMTETIIRKFFEDLSEPAG